MGVVCCYYICVHSSRITRQTALLGKDCLRNSSVANVSEASAEKLRN